MAIGEKIGGGASASAVKAGEAFFEVNVDDKGVLPQLKRIANRFAYLGGALQSIGLTAAKAGALALAPMLALFGAAVERADRMQELSERFGETAENLSALGFAADRAGVKFEELQDGFKKLDELTTRGLDGDGKALLALSQMGEDARSFSELGLADKLVTIADAFEEMTDPLERSQFLFNTFGENARKFLPLIEQGSDGLQAAFKRAADTGAIVTTEQGKQAARIKDAWDDVLTSIKSTLLSVGYALFGFTDSVESGGNTVVDFLGKVRQWTNENAALIRSIAQISAALIGGGLAVAALGKAIALLVPAVALVRTVGVTGFALIKGAILAALSPIGLIVAGVAGLTAAFLAFTDTGKKIRGMLSEAFTTIGETFGKTWEGIKAAVASGDLKGAFQIAAKGIEAVWRTMLAALAKAFKEFIQKNRDTMVLIASLTGALKGARLGRAFGPWGALIGAGVGGVGAGVGSNEALKALERALDTAELDRAAQRARDELNKLVAGAGGAAVVPGDDFARRYAEEKRKRDAMRGLGDSVRGTFGSANYRGALGAGKANEYAKKANEELKKIKEELQKLNKKPVPGFAP